MTKIKALITRKLLSGEKNIRELYSLYSHTCYFPTQVQLFLLSEKKKRKKNILKFWLFYFKVKCSWEFLVFYLCSHIFVFVFKIVLTECYNAVFQLQVAILEVYLVITFSCHNERWKWFIWIYNSAKKKKKNANTMESIETIHLLDDG